MKLAWHHQHSVFVARILLVIVWVYPCLSSVWTLLFPDLPSPIVGPGVGTWDSDRSILCALSVLSVCLVSFESWRKWSTTTWLTLGFLGWCFASSFHSSDPVGSLFFTQTWVAAACVVAATRSVLPPVLNPESRLALLHGPVVAIAVISLAPLFLTPGISRIAGPFQLPGVLSNWLLLILPLLLSDLLRAQRSLLLWAFLGSSVLALSTLILTFSRMAWLLGAVQLALLLLLESKASLRRVGGWTLYLIAAIGFIFTIRSRVEGLALLGAVLLAVLVPVVSEWCLKTLETRAIIRMGAALCLVAACVYMVDALQSRESLSEKATARLVTLSAVDSSATSRLEFWRAATAMASDHPISGVGPAQFSVNFPRYQRQFYFYSDSPHNSFLELAAEVGWIGAALFLAVGIAFGWQVKSRWEGTPLQKTSLLGLMAGCSFALTGVSYQFAVLWTTLAFVGALLLGPKPEATESKPWFPALAAGLILAGLVYLLPLQHQYELSRQVSDGARSFRLAQATSEAIPGWPAPALAALQQGLVLELPASALAPLAERILGLEPLHSGAYELVGDFFLREGRVQEAKRVYRRALALDAFNRPGVYYHLLLVADQTGDEQLKQELIREALLVYSELDQVRIAHGAHRESLIAQLPPLLFAIADGLNPYYAPQTTEPLYRFLVQYSDGPRAIHGLGASLWAQRRFEEARPYLERAHELDPAFPVPTE
jgi:O-antigen ligase